MFKHILRVAAIVGAGILTSVVVDQLLWSEYDKNGEDAPEGELGEGEVIDVTPES